MNRLWALVCLSALPLLVAGRALAEPPRVVKTTPADKATDVNPVATTEIRIAFDQPMDRDAGYSVVGGGPTFPQLVGRPRWVDDRTLVMRVALKPNQDYWLSINSDRFTNFRNRAGEPAVPYPLSFRTGAGKDGAKDAAKPQPGEPQAAEELRRRNREAVAELRRAIDQDYSYRDLRGVDWDARFAEAAPAMEAAATPAGFARAAAAMLAHAKDVHVWLTVDGRVAGTHQRRVTPNWNPRLLPLLVPNLKQHGKTVLTGRFEDGTVYIGLGTWENREPASLEAAYAALRAAADARAPAVIIDVRPNAGGDERLAQQFAGCFVDGPKVYARHVTRQNGHWSAPSERKVAPTANRPAYRGKVAVLMGPYNMSSSDSFLQMMKQVPGCVLIGETSYGSSGNPQPHPLGNGVTAYLPSWKDLLPDGTDLEGKGVAPDVTVKTTPKDFATGDPVLAKALERVRELK